MFLITWLLGGTVPSKRTIKQYEYKSPPLSLFERLFLDKFWGALPGTLYPPWLAPNVITLAGLVCIIIAIALVLHHSPALDGAAPTWVYAAVGVLIFLYQTLDGSDGKQARATGTGSALGELFDHGVDSITVVLIAVCVQDAARVGYTDETLWLCVAASTCTFYLSNCSLVAFGRQQFFDVDVQELIVCLTVLCLYCGIVGATEAPRWMITGSLCCMVLNCLQLIWKLRDTEYLGRRCKALAAIAGGVAINAATIKQVSKEPFVATVPLVCCIASAAGDLSRQLLLRRRCRLVVAASKGRGERERDAFGVRDVLKRLGKLKREVAQNRTKDTVPTAETIGMRFSEVLQSYSISIYVVSFDRVAKSSSRENSFYLFPIRFSWRRGILLFPRSSIADRAVFLSFKLCSMMMMHKKCCLRQKTTRVFATTSSTTMTCRRRGTCRTRRRLLSRRIKSRKNVGWCTKR